MVVAAIAIAAYLLGSIPFGLWIGRLRGVDLREHGSRNIGATNAGRVLGRPYAFVVFFADFGKGLAPAAVTGPLLGWWGSDQADAGWGLLAGMAAVIGHIFPLYLGFRGGKGVATAAGVFVGLSPIPALIALIVWVVVLKVGGWVAVASVVASWAFPAALFGLTEIWLGAPRSVLLGTAVAVAVLITVRHRSNLRRLMRGEEPRVGRKKEVA